MVRSRLIILINEEINVANDPDKIGAEKKKKIVAEKKKNNEANWMVSNSAKLDCRTKQHTQFGDYMARTKSWRNKKKIKK